jgi:hypothetical protein
MKRIFEDEKHRKAAEAQCRYRKEHPEAVRENNRKYRAKNREKVRRGQRKYYHTHFEESSDEHLQNGTLCRLRKALKMIGPLKNGWPDDGVSIELKIGHDQLRPDQFRRFAWLEHRGIKVLIRVADSHEECFQNHEDLLIPAYLLRICRHRGSEAVGLWDQLVKSFQP